MPDEMLRKKGSAPRTAGDEQEEFKADISLRCSTSELEGYERVIQMHAMIESAVHGIIGIDEQGLIQFFNPAAERLFAYAAEEVIGQNVSLLMPSPHRERHDGYLATYLATGKKKVIGAGQELIALRSDGSTFPIELAVSEVQLEGRRLFTGMVHDITERKQKEEQLREQANALKMAEEALLRERALLAQRVAERTAELSVANAELARAVRIKDQFLANMSHELRTPLTSILGLSEALQEQLNYLLDPRQLKALETIEKSGKHLLMVINDILDLSKIEASQVELQLEALSVAEICQTSLLFIKQEAQAKQLRLSFSSDRRIKTIYADARRLKQILVNLLSNAVKFTPARGMIGLEVQREGNVIHFTVWDTGIGIASEQMRHLFRPFMQVDGSLTRPYQGTGLGLALVARLTELHGGSVSLESEVGKGSRFTISLPSQKVAPAAPPVEAFAEPQINQDGHLILLAEDNEANIFTMTTYLETKGYRVMVARNGHEAIQRASEERPALIVMDIQMPQMDGLEAVRHLRADTLLADIPIIALTALAMTGDRERCLAAGVNEYLTKPVSLKRLVRIIAEHIKKSGE